MVYRTKLDSQLNAKEIKKVQPINDQIKNTTVTTSISFEMDPDA